MTHGLSCPKPSASSLGTVSHLGTGSGSRQGRGGTLLDSGLLLLSGTCAPGRPGGLLGGSLSLQGSSGRQDRGGWLGPLESEGCAPFPSCPTSQRASLRPSQAQHMAGPAQVPHQLCTSAQGGKAHSLLAAWPQGWLPRCAVDTGWALHCPLGSKNLKHMGSHQTLWKAQRRLPHCGSLCPGDWGSGHQSWPHLLLRLSNQSPSDLH